MTYARSKQKQKDEFQSASCTYEQRGDLDGRAVHTTAAALEFFPALSSTHTCSLSNTAGGSNGVRRRVNLPVAMSSKARLA